MRRPEKKYEKYWYAGLTGFCVIVAAVVVAAIFDHLDGVGSFFSAINTALFPVYIGLIVAYLLSPLVNKMDQYVFIPLWQKVFKEKKNKAKGIARGCSVVTVLILALLVIIGLLMLVLPEIINSVSGLLRSLPDYYKNVTDWGDHIFRSHPKIAEYYNNFSKSIFERVYTWLQNYLLTGSNKLLATVTDSIVNAASILMNLFIGLIISIYLMGSKEMFCAQGKKIMYAFMPTKRANHALSVLGETHTIFAKFISGKIIDSLVVGILTFIIMSIAGIPYTVLISVLIGVTNIIPFFGPYIGIIPSTILILVDNPSKAILFLILIIILMQLDGNILGPKILGDTIGLGSFWILFSILFFGSLFGLPGMICGVPVFAVIYRMFKRWCATRLSRKDMPTETDCYRNVKDFAQEIEEDEGIK